jgi:hypothetical protein
MSENFRDPLDDMYEALTDKYNEGREGVHVSDFLCPRQSYFKKEFPKPITNLDLGFFLLGRSMHDGAQLLCKRNPDYEIESFEIFDGVEAHIDLYRKSDNLPIEMKTARMPKMEQPKPHYLQQLHSYMAMKNSERGVIMVFLVTHYLNKINKHTPLKRWIISMTPEQLLEKKIWVLKEGMAMREARKTKDPSKLRFVMHDGDDWNFPCNNCKWLDECQTMNKQAEMNKAK